MARYSYDHIHLRSPDPETTAKFYEKMFDARIIRTPQPSGVDRIDIDINGLIVFIAGPVSGQTLPDGFPDNHYGLDHFGLRVDNMDQAAVELRAKGAEFVVEPRQLRPDVKIAFIQAPDNVRIELLERIAV